MKYYKKIHSFFRKKYMQICYLTRPKNIKTCFFSSFRGQYSDNPRAVSEYLHVIAPNLQQVWLLSRKNEMFAPDYVKVVYPGTLLAWKMQAQADVWILNCAYSRKSGVYKGKKTYYIQTWHGDRGLKKIGHLAAEEMGSLYRGFDGLPYLDDCNLFVVASEYGRRKAIEGLKFQGEFLMTGMPRNDKLVKPEQYEDEKLKIRKSLSLSEEKILLYAPTFRDGQSVQNVAINISQTLNSLEKDGSKWKCLIRSHSKSHEIKSTEDNSKFTNVSSYPDMADLLLIADFLITDYSSCAGDFALTNRPVVLALFDVDEYQEHYRTLKVNPEEAGFLVARNQAELNNICSNLYSYNHDEIAKKINSYYGTAETGSASKALAEKIVSLMS